MADTDTAEKPKEDFYSSLSGLSDAMGPVADPMVRLLREKEKSTQTEMEQKASREAASYGGKSAAASQFADAQKQAFKGYENMPARPKDVITQDTQQGLQGLAMLLPVAGLFLGAKGATSGVNAMNAMTGVLTGYKTGNQDRIAFETKKYENSIKEWEANYKIAKDGIDRAIELAKTNYQSGVAAAEAAAHKIGSVELAAMTRNKSLGEIQTIMNKIGQDYQTSKNKVSGITARAQRPMTVIDTETGKQVLADPAEIQRNPNRYLPVPKFAQQIEDRSQRMINALSGVESAVASINKLKSGATTGMLPYLSTKEGLMNYLTSATGRAMSGDQEKFMNTYLAGIGRNLATLEASGLATGLINLSNSLQSGVYISANEGPMSTANKLADIRRIAESAIQPVIEAGRISPEQKVTAQKILDKFREVIPFTTDDVADALMEKERGKSTKINKPAPVSIGEQSRALAVGRLPVAPLSTTTRKSAADRFNELEASGMSEADIFKKMQGEGY